MTAPVDFFTVASNDERRHLRTIYASFKGFRQDASPLKTDLIGLLHNQTRLNVRARLLAIVQTDLSGQVWSILAPIDGNPAVFNLDDTSRRVEGASLHHYRMVAVLESKQRASWRFLVESIDVDIQPGAATVIQSTDVDITRQQLDELVVYQVRATKGTRGAPTMLRISDVQQLMARHTQIRERLVESQRCGQFDLWYDQRAWVCNDLEPWHSSKGKMWPAFSGQFEGARHTVKNAQYVYITKPHADFGTLRTFDTMRHVNLTATHIVAFQLLSALMTLHEHTPYIHGHISADNIVIQSYATYRRNAKVKLPATQRLMTYRVNDTLAYRIADWSDVGHTMALLSFDHRRGATAIRDRDVNVQTEALARRVTVNGGVARAPEWLIRSDAVIKGAPDWTPQVDLFQIGAVMAQLILRYNPFWALEPKPLDKWTELVARYCGEEVLLPSGLAGFGAPVTKARKTDTAASARDETTGQVPRDPLVCGTQEIMNTTHVARLIYNMLMALGLPTDKKSALYNHPLINEVRNQPNMFMEPRVDEGSRRMMTWLRVQMGGGKGALMPGYLSHWLDAAMLLPAHGYEAAVATRYTQTMNTKPLAKLVMRCLQWEPSARGTVRSLLTLPVNENPFAAFIEPRVTAEPSYEWDMRQPAAVDIVPMLVGVNVEPAADAQQSLPLYVYPHGLCDASGTAIANDATMAKATAWDCSSKEWESVPATWQQQLLDAPLLALNLSENEFIEWPVKLTAGLAHCRTLMIRDNQLSVLPGELHIYPSTLQILDVSHNLLETLPSALFEQCTSLRLLNASHNALIGVPRVMWTCCPQLTHVVLSHNPDITHAHMLHLPAQVAALACRDTLKQLDCSQCAETLSDDASLDVWERLGECGVAVEFST
jgi:serine/threonine protein kinase